METLVIEASKGKIGLLLLGSIVFVAISLWLLRSADTLDLAVPAPPLLIKVISVLAIVFFSLSGLYAMTKLFDNRPGLVINDKGLIDTSSAVSAGFISYEEITGIHVTEMYGQKALTIAVRNPEEILAKQSGLKKFLMGLNKDYFSSPIQISASTLETDFDQLHATIQERLAAYRSGQSGQGLQTR